MDAAASAGRIKCLVQYHLAPTNEGLNVINSCGVLSISISKQFIVDMKILLVLSHVRAGPSVSRQPLSPEVLQKVRVTACAQLP